jgi:ABC-2 type transport system ATP-binding protein
MRTSSVVTVRGLRKSYAGRLVVDNVDLDVAEGEVVGIIGANGAGKTTTVECIQGMRAPDGGTIRVLGLDPSTEAERLRPLIGSQLQQAGLPDRLRVGEAVELFARTRDRGGERLLAQFGLAERRRCAFASLSGGERQRLFLVLALLGDPRLVILDELTQGLDPAARRNVWASVQALRDEGKTVLLVTHELDEAEALCDRVVAMRAGEVLDCGSPAELVDRHAQLATIRFGEICESVDGAGEPTQAPLDELCRAPGVQLVERTGGRIVVRGDRRAIAYVGEVLVRAGFVPRDLSVRIPSLEDALLDLLGAQDNELEGAIP